MNQPVIDKNSYLKLFFTGALQVFFVAANTIFITSGNILWLAIFGFLISFIWSHNIRKIAFGSMKDRIFYSMGATLGSLVGYLFASWISV
jgi:hypothetical protein